VYQLLWKGGHYAGAELSHQPVVQDWIFGSAVPANPEPKFRLEVHGERDAGRIEPHLAGHPNACRAGHPKVVPTLCRIRAASVSEKVGTTIEIFDGLLSDAHVLFDQ